MYWSPNFLAVVFKKQEISQQIVTRMHDLASECSKIFRGDTPDPHNGRGRPLPHPTPSPAFGRARGASAPVLGPKSWSPPSTFRPWLRPWRIDWLLSIYRVLWVLSFCSDVPNSWTWRGSLVYTPQLNEAFDRDKHHLHHVPICSTCRLRTITPPGGPWVSCTGAAAVQGLR